MGYHAHGFVDGGYLRKVADSAGTPWVNPRTLVNNVVSHGEVQTWGAGPHSPGEIFLTRVSYYDARPDDRTQASPDLQDYWNAIELLPDTQLGFGVLRGGLGRRAPRQEGVDTLLAVDMLVGAFTKVFSVAILVAGDADFVPVIEEVRRSGAMVVLAAEESSLSTDLRRAADRFIKIGPKLETSRFPPLSQNGRTWSSAPEDR